MEYKTVEIRVPGPEQLNEERFTLPLNEMIHTGNVGMFIKAYSQALFETLHPKVKITRVTGINEEKALMTAIAGGTAP